FPYTWAFHKPVAADGEANPHFHLMFSERQLDEVMRAKEQFFSRYNRKNPVLGGNQKNRFFSSRQFVSSVRKEWTRTANEYLERQGLNIRIDDRSYLDRGINLESQAWKKSFAKDKQIAADLDFKISENVRDIMKRNGDRIIADPSIAIAALTSNQSAFTLKDLEKFLFSHTDGEQQYIEAYNAVLASESLQKLTEGNYYTSTEMYLREADIIEKVDYLSLQNFPESEKQIVEAIRQTRTFNKEQNQAYDLLVSSSALVAVNGAAGTGKSYVLSAMNEAYLQQGLETVGVAVQAATAKDMQESGGIQSYNLAAFFKKLERQEIVLSDKTIIVLDEAGMVGSEQMQRLLSIAVENKCRVRMVGDSYQLAAVSAGNAFAALQRNLAAENQCVLNNIMRQKNETMRQASIALSGHRIADALDIYDGLNRLVAVPSEAELADRLVTDWYRDNSNRKVMLAHSNKDTGNLNHAARLLMKADGTLGKEDYTAAVSYGGQTRTIRLAENEQVVFKRNDHGLGVVNGETGTVTGIRHYDGEAEYLTVRLTGGRTIEVALAEYNALNHAYAMTIHQSQGLTVENSYVLAGSSMNANLAYVAMTRHKQDMHIYYAEETFSGGEDGNSKWQLKKSLSRAEEKLFVGDKSLLDGVEQFKREQMLHHRPTLAENRFGVRGLPDFEKRRLLKYAPTDVTEPLPELLGNPDLIAGAYRQHLRDTGRAVQQYELGGMKIGKGDVVQFNQAYKQKTGFFKSVQFETGTPYRIQSIDAEKKALTLIDREKREYTVPADDVSLRFADKYVQEYKNNPDFRQAVNVVACVNKQKELLEKLRTEAGRRRQTAMAMRERNVQKRRERQHL
ncbi:MAG: AAA family ATPase, partial [Neisseria animaloris]|nr:AAA family ATPase [Neisseria animaloris]